MVAQDLDQSRQWLANEKLRTQSPTGYVDVWLKSGLPWLICDRPEDRDTLEKYGQVVWENPGWLIVRRKADVSGPSSGLSPDVPAAPADVSSAPAVPASPAGAPAPKPQDAPQ